MPRPHACRLGSLYGTSFNAGRLLNAAVWENMGWAIALHCHCRWTHDVSMAIHTAAQNVKRLCPAGLVRIALKGIALQAWCAPFLAACHGCCATTPLAGRWGPIHPEVFEVVLLAATRERRYYQKTVIAELQACSHACTYWSCTWQCVSMGGLSSGAPPARGDMFFSALATPRPRVHGYLFLCIHVRVFARAPRRNYMLCVRSCHAGCALRSASEQRTFSQKWQT